MPQVSATGEFSGELNGRAGHILYREAAKEIPIYWELSVHKELDGSRSYGVSVTCDFQYWAMPKAEPISEKHQLEILAALRVWLHTQGKRSSIDLPKDLSEDPDNCLYKGCHRRRIKGIYYCGQHFDLSCLVNIRKKN
jgi:hypothetical protein